MSHLTKEYIQLKLSNWTPSTQVQALLNLTSLSTAQFKKTLESIEAKGWIERQGAKKGLKFRSTITSSNMSVTSDNESNETPSASIPNEVSKPSPVVKSKKVSNKSNLNVKDIPCQIVNIPRHEFTSEVTHVELGKLLSYVLKSQTSTRLLSIRKTPSGVTIKTYNDNYILSEVTYSKADFIKLLELSNITLE